MLFNAVTRRTESHLRVSLELAQSPTRPPLSLAARMDAPPAEASTAVPRPIFTAIDINVAGSDVHVSATIDGASFDSGLLVAAWANLWFVCDSQQFGLVTVNGAYEAGRVDYQFPRVLSRLADGHYEAHVLVQVAQRLTRDTSGRYRGGDGASAQHSAAISVVNGRGSKYCLMESIGTK